MCEKHTHEVLGLRGSQAGVYHFIIGDSEIGRQSGTELGQHIWIVSLLAKHASVIVISE